MILIQICYLRYNPINKLSQKTYRNIPLNKILKLSNEEFLHDAKITNLLSAIHT